MSKLLRRSSSCDGHVSWYQARTYLVAVITTCAPCQRAGSGRETPLVGLSAAAVALRSITRCSSTKRGPAPPDPPVQPACGSRRAAGAATSRCGGRSAAARCCCRTPRAAPRAAVRSPGRPLGRACRPERCAHLPLPQVLVRVKPDDSAAAQGAAFDQIAAYRAHAAAPAAPRLLAVPPAVPRVTDSSPPLPRSPHRRRAAAARRQRHQAAGAQADGL